MPAYTIRTARMSLADARHVMATTGWTPDQQARARAVIAHWAKIRKAQAKRAATKQQEPTA